MFLYFRKGNTLRRPAFMVKCRSVQSLFLRYISNTLNLSGQPGIAGGHCKDISNFLGHLRLGAGAKLRFSTEQQTLQRSPRIL